VPKLIRVFLVLGTFFVLSALGVLAGVAYAYLHRFYPGVYVAGVSLSGQTYGDGKKLIEKKVESYASHSFHVVIPDPSHPVQDSPNLYADQEVSTEVGNLGVTFDSAGALGAAWSVGHSPKPATWFRSVLPAFFLGKKTDIRYEVNPDVIKTFVFTQVVPKMGSPVPSQIAVQEGSISITPPRPGFVVDEKALQAAIAGSLAESTESDISYVRAPVTQVESPITEGVVRPLADTLDKLGNIKLNLSGAQNALVPTRAQVLTWFTPIQDPKGNVSLSLQKTSIDHYLSQVAPKTVDTKQSVDIMAQTLTPYLANASSVSLAPINIELALKPVASHTAEPGNYSLNKFPSKYIEVNLAEQKMYRINGGILEKTYLVSSGKASTPTPTGIFHLHGKSPRAYSYLYGLYMPWWENFLNGEYGIHELPVWPNGYREGEGHLGIPVSDGCVRLGIGDAKEVYDWTEDGTPVYIH
jgi:lipoprotein-anchoring transpeptidase ErfK/SrfK